MKEGSFRQITFVQQIGRWVRKVVTIIIGFCMVLVWTGVNNTLLDFFAWHTGPQAMPSITYSLDPLGQVMAWGFLCFLLAWIWWPVLSRKVAGQHD